MSDFAPNPAQMLTRLFHELAPQAAAAVEKPLARLFQALSEGHSFIFVKSDEAEALRQAAPLVGTEHAPLILQGKRLFLGRYYALERGLAAEIQRLCAQETPTPAADTAAQLAELFNDEGSRDQQAAAALTLLNNFMLISGGPGTGKTTTVTKLLFLLCRDWAESDYPRIALAAPTGKAAARLSESLHAALGRIAGSVNMDDALQQHLRCADGQTVHRLLGLKPPQMQPAYGRDKPLPYDILLLDEASMLDSHLLLQLLAAVPNRCRVILLGDENQLPSVGAGAVLQALAQCPPLPHAKHTQLQQWLGRDAFPLLREHTARLSISHRFGSDSPIGNLARAVVAGEAEQAWQQFARYPEHLQQHDDYTPERLAAQLYQAQHGYWQAIDAGDAAAAFRHQGDVCVLAATHHDADALNQAYRRLLQSKQRIQPEQNWFAGQIIMISRNDHTQKLYNGDIGIIMPHRGSLHACFPTADSVRHIPLARLPEHDPAFAITVHKSQGSEYTQVWLIAPKNDNPNYSRALLYTALTRAKSQFTYWGSETGFHQACRHTETRRSALADFLYKQ